MKSEKEPYFVLRRFIFMDRPKGLCPEPGAQPVSSSTTE